MTYSLKFTIQGLPRTQNGLNRGHWRVRKSHADKWKREVLLAVAGKIPDKPLEKAKLTITRHSSRAPDFDGLVGSNKCIVDSLVLAKVLVDDSMAVLGQPSYKWEKAVKGKGFITVEVEG